MKNTNIEQFKKIDVFISTFLIVLFASLMMRRALIDHSYNGKMDSAVSCLFVGMWQIFSMLIHNSKSGLNINKRVRRFYYFIILVALLTFAACIANNSSKYGEILFTYVLPSMAIFYTCICFNETYGKNKTSLKIVFTITTIIVAILVTTITLSHYANLVQHLLNVSYNWQFELLMVLGMLLFQYLFIYKENWNAKMDYFFKMLLVSLLGSILLWPLLLANQQAVLNDKINIGYFLWLLQSCFLYIKKLLQKCNYQIIFLTLTFCIDLLFYYLLSNCEKQNRFSRWYWVCR
jgi:hypothetical protein